MLSSTSPIDRPSLHPGTRYLITPRVPRGLASVVEGLTREVLRHRPEDIYVFAAHHFEKLLKLREQYHAEEYSGREFDHEFDCDFKLWPTKKAKDIERSSNSDWSLEKENFERCGKVSADVEESTDVSTGRENRRTRQTCSRNVTTTKRTSKKSKDHEATSSIRATRIISQMSALPGKNIQTKDIKQELRRNKLSGEKAKSTDDKEKETRNGRHSRTKISKTDKDLEEEVERATTTTTTTTSSSRTSARRPLRKVPRIETESETETETMAKTENGYKKSGMKNNSESSETGTESKDIRPEARFSEISFKRKVSSRALSVDRIRAYVLRKFASSASLEVLRSSTYVEQIQEVIDRAAPIIKEKLEEIREPRGKRSRSADLAWSKESSRRRIREEKKYYDYEREEESKGKTRNELSERKVDAINKEETENSLYGDERISNGETEEKKSRRRSVGSGRRTRRRESGGYSDVGIIDQVDGKHSDKLLKYESGATQDTLEAKLTATQNILEDISKSIYDLGGARKNDSAESELPESEVSDHANVVSLPIVRPPSSRNSRSATRNGSDSLILPPISPEVSKTTKKKDELSLPVLPVTVNGNHSSRKSQDVEEASTMHDITNDMEDIEILPEDDHEKIMIDAEQNSDLISSLTSDVRFTGAERHEQDEDMDDVPLEHMSEQFTEKRGSFEELERNKVEEIFKDSLNVTPEVVDVRPDSLESDEEQRLRDNNVDLARVNTFDGLKDKLIEIEMVERNIEMALASQQLTMHDDNEETGQAEKSMIDGKINDIEKSVNKVEETVNEVEKSADVEKISMNKDEEEKKRHENIEEKNMKNEIEEVQGAIETSMNQMENSSNKTENSKDTMIGKIENTANETETSMNEIEKSTNKKNKAEILKNGETRISHVEILITKAIEEAIKVPEEKKSMNKTEKSMNEKSTDIEKLTANSHIENEQSTNPKSQNNDNQVTQTVICETDDDKVTASKNKTENTVNELSKITVCGNVSSENEISATNLSDENIKMNARKKREIEKVSVATSLSLELPFSYVLSEGSPCEIPDSVTTVIIPDRHCPSPVTLEDGNYQIKSTSQKEESFIHSNIHEKSETQENKCGMEIFGEYIQPEAVILPVDIDFVRDTRGIKSSQLVIGHQDLDRIKEEGEEEEKKAAEKKELESPRKQEDDKQSIHEEETKAAILENIMKHEANEETSAKMTSRSKDAEEISKVSEYKSLPDTVELIANTGLTDEENMNFIIESRDTIENSSEENGSTQDTRTITSSEVRESTASNRSVESPSLDRPIVPELNLDSLQDNTVSSFKMTANGTATKEDNNSSRESDTTTSLVEPLISDERLTNQPILAEEDAAVEDLTESLSRYLQPEVPEADQLYQAEHAEYECLEKDLSSMETNLEDEAKSPENSIGLQALPEDVVLIGPLLRDGKAGQLEEEMEKKLENEKEIARELISSLEEDLQLNAKEVALEKEFKDNGEPEKSSLNVNISNRSLSDFVDEQEKREYVIDNKTVEPKLEIEEKDSAENKHIAPLAQFEQDELEFNITKTVEEDEEKITVKSKLGIIDTVSADNQKNLENKQTSVEEVIENKNNETTNKIEELHERQKEIEEKMHDKEECEQEKLEIHEGCQKSEKHTQEDLNIQEKDNYENMQLEENIVDMKTMPSETTESRECSINDSTNNDEHEKTKLITRDEFVIEDKTEKKKPEDLPAKTENGLIENLISEQSTKDQFHGGYWITETKSSTVETVIETSNSNTNTGRMDSAADASEMIKNKSLIQKKDDFYSAVVKIQACFRGFLMRRRMKNDMNLKLKISDNDSPAQKPNANARLTVSPSSLQETRTGRQRLRREEALRNTTLSVENAFATGRLQHTGEFHDSVPLPLFDPIYYKTDSTTSEEFLSKTIEEDTEQTNQSDIAKSNSNESNSTNGEHGGSFQKGNVFAGHTTFPIVMHLLADASHNCHFTVGQSSHSNFNTNAGGAKPTEPTLADILMLGYPRDDENRYLNFITSVEDLGSNMDSLPLDDGIKRLKNVDDSHPSTTSGEGSIREPLALPGTPQGVVIEEMTSLDTELLPSESATKPSTVSKTSLDTNSSVPSEECTPEDEENVSGTSPRIVDATGDRKNMDGETETQRSDRNLESIPENDSHDEDEKNKESSEVSCDNHERVEGEENERT